jgi:hypothetical protein
MPRNLLFFILLFVLSFSGCAAIDSPPYKPPSIMPPQKTVLLFAETYGTGRMDETGQITTESFRDDKPVSVWVPETWKYGFEHSSEVFIFTCHIISA